MISNFPIYNFITKIKTQTASHLYINEVKSITCHCNEDNFLLKICTTKSENGLRCAVDLSCLFRTNKSLNKNWFSLVK